MRVSCRGPFKTSESVEGLFVEFLEASFSSRFVYIISPWITPFNLSNPFIFYPFTSSQNIAKIIESLTDLGVEVKVLTRCIDDLISGELLQLLELVVVRGNDELVGYVADRIRDTIDRIEGVLKFRKILGNNLLFDYTYHINFYYRLHGKIYVNDKMALVGSANFTRGGVVEGGNWECLVKAYRGDPLYEEVRSYAEAYLGSGGDHARCMARVEGLMREVSKVDRRIRDLEDVVEILREFLV